MDASDLTVIQQHLIDPEICIRCNTCEATCPVNAISHDDTNYVVDADICNGCMACISPCPTGSIDNWRQMPKSRAYSLDEQLGWEALPAEWTVDQLADAGVVAGTEVADPAPSQRLGPAAGVLGPQDPSRSGRSPCLGEGAKTQANRT